MRSRFVQKKRFVKSIMFMGGTLLLLLLVLFQTAFAGENQNNTPTNRELIITEVYVDFEANTIVISGKNFDNGGVPTVLLGNYPEPLTLIGTPTDDEIVVELPDVPDGDYLLKVSTGEGVIRYDAYNLTIGAVAMSCNPGDSLNCYTGDISTLNVGVCKGGIRYCNKNGIGFGPCIGEVIPTSEVCGDGLDNDCDGGTDEGCGYCGDGTCDAWENRVNCRKDCAVCSGTADSLCYIGDRGPAGGYVFRVTHGGLHGHEVAPSDQGSAPWGCSGTAIAGADGTAAGAGSQNTADILAGCSESGIAARIASNYMLNGYNDWFLPSFNELNALYYMKTNIGGFDSSKGYWTSSEVSNYGAWFIYFGDGSYYSLNKSYVLKVRAIRAF